MNTKKANWKICDECQGQGKILRGPSRKRRRIFKIESDIFAQTGGEGIAPTPLTSNLAICSDCNGSGLSSSAVATPAAHESYPHIAIIGGGIGGTAFAVACLHRGIPFTLYERDESFTARSQGYGLTLQQASKAIEGLGLFSLDDGVISTRHVVHNPVGKVIGEWGLRKWKIPFEDANTRRRNVHISRQSLRSALMKELSDTESVKWGHKFIGYNKNKNGLINLDFEVGGKKEAATADLVVGADGIRSAVRSILIDDKATPLQYLGCIVILGICPLKSLSDFEHPLLDSATVFQTVNGHERMYVMPYDTDTVMWQLSFPLDEEEAQKLSQAGAAAMKQEAFKRLQWHNPIPQMLAATEESAITGYPVYDRDLLDPVSLADAGNITLIGDAAHPMSPFKGQGANQALLDALSLARLISAEYNPDNPWQADILRRDVLSIFETEMLERTASKVRDSARAVELLHSDAVLHEGDEPRGRGFGV